MKRIPCTAVMALGLMLASQQQASAYCKFNFGVGLNLGWEGANNSVLWGVLKGGPGPGMSDGSYPAFAAGYPSGGHSQINQGFDPSYAAPAYPPSGTAMPMATMPYPAPMTQVRPMPQMPRAEMQPVGYFSYPTYPTYPTYPMYYPYYINWYYGNWYGY